MFHRTIFTDPSVAQFYELGETVRPDYELCKIQAKTARSILDLGCGTGELTVQLTKGRHVVGLDPARAMLDIARARTGGENVTWIEGDARNFSLNEHFDLVFLTGHSFQFLLSEEDQLSALNCIAKHLSPNGRLIFDTRNPDFAGRKTRVKHETLQRRVHPDLGEIESWNTSEYDKDSQTLSFVNTYKHIEIDEVYSAPSQIKYTSQNKVEALIQQAGLCVDEWLGEWTGEPYHPTSREIIPIGRKA